jgi:hypothetical protein
VTRLQTGPRRRCSEVDLDPAENEALAFGIDRHQRNKTAALSLADDPMPRKFSIEFDVFLSPRRILGFRQYAGEGAGLAKARCSLRPVNQDLDDLIGRACQDPFPLGERQRRRSIAFLPSAHVIASLIEQSGIGQQLFGNQPGKARLRSSSRLWSL